MRSAAPHLPDVADWMGMDVQIEAMILASATSEPGCPTS